MKFLTTDIETVPQEWALDPDRVEAADWWVEENEAEDPIPLIRGGAVPLAGTNIAAALHPSTCRVVSVAFASRKDDGIKTHVICPEQTPEDWDIFERELVRLALRHIGEAVEKRSRIVGFNSKSFDLPVLRVRAAMLGLRIAMPWQKLLYPFSDSPHCDLRLLLGNGDRRAKGTLKWWCDAFGIECTEAGAEVFDRVQAEDWPWLADYGIREGHTLVELFEHVQGVL